MFDKTEIEQLIELANQIQPSPFLVVAKEIFNKGKIEGEAEINFDNTGRVKDDYKIEGSIYNFNAKINLLINLYLKDQ